MFKLPRFQYHYHVKIVQEENVVYLLSEKGHSCLRGYVYTLLAPLLDGTNSFQEILEIVSPFVPEERIHEAFARLIKQSLLTETEPNLPEAASAFWNLHGIDTAEAYAKITAKTVSVTAIGGLDRQPFVDMLDDLGIRTAPSGDIEVVLTDDYMNMELFEFNSKRLADKKPWLLFKPVGSMLWIGPVFNPPLSGCLECLAHRLRENRIVELSLQNQLHISAPFPVSRAVLPASYTAACSLAAVQTALQLVRPDESLLQGQIVTIDSRSLQTGYHTVSKREQCTACGTPRILPPQELVLQSRKKIFTEDGGHRVCPPAETLRRFKHLVSPISGIVGEIKPLFGDKNGLISIYSGTHRMSLANNNFSQLQSSLRSNSTGKGKSELQSRASALCEALERYSAIYQGNEYRIRASGAGIDKAHISLQACMLYSEAQYLHREVWNKGHLSLDYVPLRLDPDRVIDWTPVWSFTHGIFKYVPTANCYLQYSEPDNGAERYHNIDSNGLAAGNVLEEAILQGFFEVIERDSLSIWWYNRIRRPAVNLDSLHSSYIDALREYYKSISREFWVLDVTSDSTVPACAAVSRRIDGATDELILGFGAHFDPHIAVTRALTEMNQALYLAESGRLSDRAVTEREIFMKEWFSRAKIENLSYLQPDPQADPVNVNSYIPRRNNDILQDLEECFGICRTLDLELLVHNLTRSDVKMSAVKVIIPGMRHIRARFAPGRLYDVPVRQGWLDKPTPENQFNPISFWT
jgi:oxazoline/thiazoline synthase